MDHSTKAMWKKRLSSVTLLHSEKADVTDRATVPWRYFPDITAWRKSEN